MKMKKMAYLSVALLAFSLGTDAASVPTIAAEQINLEGYNLRCDSFHSSDTNRSTGGHYDPAKAGDGCYVGLNNGIFNSSHAGNARIWGQLDTQAPFTLEIGPAGSIGSAAWQLAGTPGIEPGHHTTNYNLSWPDVPAPFPGFVPMGGTVDGITYTYILNAGDYELNQLSLSGNQKVLVTGTARLHVRGEVKLSGNASIRIEPAARLQLYVGGAAANLSGGGIINLAGSQGFIYLGLAGNTSLTFKVSAVSGLIYAPRTDCTITSPGHAISEMEGNIIVKSLSLAADLNLHFDEALNP